MILLYINFNNWLNFFESPIFSSIFLINGVNQCMIKSYEIFIYDASFPLKGHEKLSQEEWLARVLDHEFLHLSTSVGLIRVITS